MTTQFNLPLVITGRIAVNEDKEVVCYEVAKGYTPEMCSKKLKGFAWEVTVGKSGEHTKTRFYLDADRDFEVDSKFVVALKLASGDTERYSIQDGTSDNALDNDDVTALLAAKGTKHGNDFNRKFVKVMTQGCSLLKDRKRPLTVAQRDTLLKAHDKLFAEYRRLLLDEPSTKAKSNEIPDLI
jgi:hypothetical protein